jgi:hypothetical protein
MRNGKPTMSKGERDDLIRLIRQRERAQKTAAQRLREWSDASFASFDARQEERKAPPLYEILADTFDLKSARFASIRPRLVKHLQFVIAELKANAAWNRHRNRPCAGAEEERKLERAREILNLLNPEPRRACASCGKLFLPTRRDAVTCSPGAAGRRRGDRS